MRRTTDGSRIRIIKKMCEEEKWGTEEVRYSVRASPVFWCPVLPQDYLYSTGRTLASFRVKQC
jgi:hypothetical protein